MLLQMPRYAKDVWMQRLNHPPERVLFLPLKVSQSFAYVSSKLRFCVIATLRAHNCNYNKTAQSFSRYKDISDGYSLATPTTYNVC